MNEISFQEGLVWLQQKDPEAVEVIETMCGGSKELTKELVSTLYGEKYSKSSHLALKEKLLVVLAITISNGNMLPQTAYQSRLGYLCGLSEEEIYEICGLAAVFSGFATSLNAMNTIRDTLDRVKTPRLSTEVQ